MKPLTFLSWLWKRRQERQIQYQKRALFSCWSWIWQRQPFSWSICPPSLYCHYKTPLHHPLYISLDCAGQSSAKGWGGCVLAKLGTGFVANNPLSPPPLLLLLHPYCCNCTNMQSIIGTALRCCGNNPPNILRLRRGLESWLADFFIHWQPKFQTEKIRPLPQPFSQGLFVIDSRGILPNVSWKAITHHQSPCKIYSFEEYTQN